MKISILTLGCRVNQYESNTIKEELISLGYDATTKLCKADYYVLNTCAVTNEAEHKSRSYITKIEHINSNAKIVVCGCASENNQEQLIKGNNVIYIIGNNGKNKISKFLDDYIKNNQNNLQNGSENCATKIDYKKLENQYENFSAIQSSTTRAYLKIQDGCNNFCSYCLIPYIRGRSRSRDLQQIVREAEILSKTNKEIVLTGINMSDYKVDGELSLSLLLKSLSNINARISIGSLEVNVINEEFLEVAKAMPNFCPHFHLSMQSGCDRILKLMNRHYTKSEYLSKVELIRKYFPLANITTDVIVGFPTETDDDFNETLDTIKKANFYKMHIFPYSSRIGTRAEKMEQVNGNKKIERKKILEKLDIELQTKFLKAVSGKVQTVLTENIEKDFVVGHTECFIKVYLPLPLPLNSLISVKLTTKYKNGIKAEIIG